MIEGEEDRKERKEKSDPKKKEKSDSKKKEKSDSKKKEKSDSKKKERSDSKKKENSDSKKKERSDSKKKERSDSKKTNSDSKTESTDKVKSETKAVAKTDSTVVNLSDSIIAITPDSLSSADPVYGILLTPPKSPDVPRRQKPSDLSWITLSLFLVFFIACFRFQNNIKFIGAIGRSLLVVKERNSIFDDTVRETSFVIILNLLWCVATGVILYRLLQAVPDGMFLSANPVGAAAGMAICMGVAVIYSLFMTGACLTVGNLFSDALHAGMWVRGYAASQGILGVAFFPLALAMICWPTHEIPLLWIAAVLFILARSLFIWKGFRIFFTHSSSWVLFLYYLCSLEIVPLILSYAAAAYLCRL